jgi:hypothetical protein
MATVKETIASDITDVFLNTEEFADEAYWTPCGGSVQPVVAGFHNKWPLHGDEYQENPVVQPSDNFMTKSSLVSSWKARDNVTINGTVYQIINDPYPRPDDNNWSIVPLRHPRNQEPKI